MDPDVQKLQIDARNKEVAAADAKAKAATLAAQKLKAKPVTASTEADEEAGEEMHPEGCKCTDCVQHPEKCKCGCQDHEEASEEKHDWKDCECEKCKRARYIADHVDREDWPADMKESTQITNFIKAI